MGHALQLETANHLPKREMTMHNEAILRCRNNMHERTTQLLVTH
jgi:hypothetical protein